MRTFYILIIFSIALGGTQKMSKEEIKNKLTDIQYDVTQNCGTEPPFKNEFWYNKEPGIYVDVVSGEPLFCSIHKYDSGTGWPSFSEALPGAFKTKVDRKFGMVRTEIRSKSSGIHLGHVFPDGPNGHPRYCINATVLDFKLREDFLTTNSS